MQFCPTCGNMLLISSSGEVGGLRFCCGSCPYVHSIKKSISQKQMLKRKVLDDVLGGADAWKNVDQTEGTSGGHKHTIHYQTDIHTDRCRSDHYIKHHIRTDTHS